MEEWKEYKLGEISNITKLAGFEFTKYIKYNTTGEIIALRALNVRNGRLDLTEIKRIDKSVSDALPRSKLYKGEILFTYTGNGYGDCALVDADDKYHLAPNICKISPNPGYVESNFLFQIIRSKSFYQQVKNYIGGSSQPTIPMETIRQLKVRIPSLPTQQKIAAILSSLDDKIELNNKINENLEQQAQAIFKNWFVDNDSNLAEIEIGKLDILITDYVANGSFKDLADNVKYLTEETNNVLIRLTDYNNNFSSDMVYISDESYDFLEKSKLYGDEIIISNVGANVGTVFRCPRLSKRMSLAPNSIMIRANNYEHYLYLFFTSAYGQGLLKSIVTGSAQPKFNKTNFRSLKIKIPNEEQLSKFNNIYDSIHEKIINNQKENMNLASIRDSLLPKLMNGEIEV